MDYGSGPYTVTIPAGMTSVPFNISITDDGILEGNEDFMLTINPSPLPTGVSVGSPDQATVTIVDVGSKQIVIVSHGLTHYLTKLTLPNQVLIMIVGTIHWTLYCCSGVLDRHARLTFCRICP